MFFLPVAFLAFIAFILFLPVLFLLGYFHIITLGFENLGISPGTTIFLLLMILIGSGINIPLTQKKLTYVERPRFFGLWKAPRIEASGIAINLGGAIIPILLSFYFIFLILRQGFSLQPVLIAILFMTLLCKSLARIVPGRGIVLPFLIPPVFSVIFAFILAPNFVASCAFISGVLGTLLGADILNLHRIKKIGGFVSIGGAGVFDGIFLIGIISALLAF